MVTTLNIQRSGPHILRGASSRCHYGYALGAGEPVGKFACELGSPSRSGVHGVDDRATEITFPQDFQRRSCGTAFGSHTLAQSGKVFVRKSGQLGSAV